jgi:hypothetical protein
MGFQRLSSESRHTPIVAADGNPPPFFHGVGAGFRHVLAKSLRFTKPFRPCFLRLLRFFAANRRKSLSINNLQLNSSLSNQA